jgi:hypothetical protein
MTDARLELAFVEQPVAVRIDQTCDPTFHLLQQAG